MDDQSGLVNLENLLLQLALETRELAQKKDDLTQQIQLCKDGIREKTECIKDTRHTIKTLEEHMQQTENTIRCYKANVKSLRGTSHLLLQYEEMLEAELKRRQESCDQDMKMFQERVENYRKTFQQHEEEYLKDPVAAKLAKIQAENEEIERRIRATEKEIAAKEKELKAWRERTGTGDSVQRQVESIKQQATASDTSDITDVPSRDPQAQVARTEQQDVQTETDDQADGGDESKSSEVGGIGGTAWPSSVLREHIQEADPGEQEHTAEVEMNTSTSIGSDTLENMMEAEEQEEASAEDGEQTASPTHTGVPDTPTFSLISSSPSTSQSQQEGGGTPAFVFSMNSGPNTPTFSGFDFEVGLNQHEESPFTFPSSYFSKKSPETKLPGFLFDESESRPHEDFAFSFSSKSPQSKESVGTRDTFPFSFNFGKF